MSSERFWIVLLAGTSFLAGLAGGVLLSFSLRLSPEPEPVRFAAYETRMVGTFQLDEERERLLHQALASYDEEVEGLKARTLRELEPELAELGRTCRERIRHYVIPVERRVEFDRRAAGGSAEPTTPR